MKKKRDYISITFLVLLFITQAAGCNKQENNQENKNKSCVDTTESTITEYSLEEIYPQGFDDYITDPTYHRILIYPMKDRMYSCSPLPLWTYINDSNEISTYSVCQDPLCDHSSLPCLSYVLGTNISDFVESNGKLYLIIHEDDPYKCQLIEYDPEAGKYVVLGEFDYGGEVLGKLGRFVYFYIIRFDGQTESLMQLTTRIIYRYDILESKTEKLIELPQNYEVWYTIGYNGYIYYTDKYRKLYRCDANFQNKETIIDEKIEKYSLTRDYIYYLTKENEEHNTGTLYALDIKNNTGEILYKDIMWFYIENNTLYYSRYDPVEAFEWDFATYDEDWNKKIERRTITVNHGNKIYSINLENAGEKEGKLLSFSETLRDKGYYLSESYTVYNGFLFSQSREEYSEGDKKGIKSGVAAISIETGEVFQLSTEYIMQS